MTTTLDTENPVTWHEGDEAWMLVTPTAGCLVRIETIRGPSAIVALVGQNCRGTCWLRDLRPMP